MWTTASIVWSLSFFPMEKSLLVNRDNKSLSIIHSLLLLKHYQLRPFQLLLPCQKYREPTTMHTRWFTLLINDRLCYHFDMESIYKFTTKEIIHCLFFTNLNYQRKEFYWKFLKHSCLVDFVYKLKNKSY